MTKAKDPKAVKRASPGAGSFKWDAKRELWVGRLTLPIDPITGKSRRQAVTGVDKDATFRRFKAAQNALLVRGNARTRNPSLAEYLGEWQKNLTVRPRTTDSYRANCRLYILPAIGKVKLSQLTRDDIRKLQNFVLRKGLSSTTARTVLTVALNQAMADRILDWNSSAALKRLAAEVIDEQFLSNGRPVVACPTYRMQAGRGARFGALTGEPHTRHRNH